MFVIEFVVSKAPDLFEPELTDQVEAAFKQAFSGFCTNGPLPSIGEAGFEESRSPGGRPATFRVCAKFPSASSDGALSDD